MSQICIKAQHFRSQFWRAANFQAAQFINSLPPDCFRYSSTCEEGDDFVITIFYSE